MSWLRGELSQPSVAWKTANEDEKAPILYTAARAVFAPARALAVEALAYATSDDIE